MTTAIILAGGLGTRLRSVVSNVPKPMAPIEGRPFLEYLMDYWIEQGIEHFVISTGYLAETISNHFGNSYRAIPIDYAIEESPMGTGGAVLLTLEHLQNDSPFLLLNGDTFFSANLKKLMLFHKEKKADWTLSLSRSDEQERYMSVQLDENNKIVSLTGNKKEKNKLINAGTYIITPNVLKFLFPKKVIKLSLEDDILPQLFAQEARIFGLESKGAFIDIGIPGDYKRAGQVLKLSGLNENEKHSRNTSS